jgi:hypothetical protein
MVTGADAATQSIAAADWISDLRETYLKGNQTGNTQNTNLYQKYFGLNFFQGFNNPMYTISGDYFDLIVNEFNSQLYKGASLASSANQINLQNKQNIVEAYLASSVAPSSPTDDGAPSSPTDEGLGRTVNASAELMKQGALTPVYFSQTWKDDHPLPVGSTSPYGFDFEVGSIIPYELNASYGEDGATVVANFGPTSKVNTSFSITFGQSDGSSGSVTVGDSSTSYTKSNSSNGWGAFFVGNKNSSSSQSDATNTSFSSYSGETTATGATIAYDKISIQTWQPSSIGLGSWMPTSELREALVTSTKYTDEDSGKVVNTLPYTQGPNFPGGYGFTDPGKAMSMVKSGFAIPSSSVYSVNPSVTISGSNSTKSGSDWSESTFSQSDYSSSEGVGFFGWVFGGTGKSSSSSSTSSSTRTNSITNQEGGGFTLTTSGLGNVNEGVSGKPDPMRGYAATEIAYGVNEVAPARPNFVAGNESSARASDKSIDLLESRKNSIKYGYEFSNLDSTASVAHYNKKSNVILGSNIKDLITAGGGADEVYGGGGRDLIYAGTGSDYVHGGMGVNKLYGGPGKDYFHVDYSMLGGKKRSLQKIMDFEPTTDVLWVVNASPEYDMEFNRKTLSIDGMTAARFKGLSASELEIVIDTAQFI